MVELNCYVQLRRHAYTQFTKNKFQTVLDKQRLKTRPGKITKQRLNNLSSSSCVVTVHSLRI